MPFIPVPNVCEVALLYASDGQQIRTVLHYKEAAAVPYDLAALEALGGVINSQWSAQLQASFTPNVEYFGCSLRALDSESAPATEVLVDVLHLGTAAGTVVQDNVAFALKKVTGLGGRSFRGRIYMFGFSQSNLAGPGELGSSFANYLKEQWIGFLNHVADGDTNSVMQVVSKYHGVANAVVGGRYKRQPIPRAEGISTPVATFSYTDLLLDSQRRRLPGRGS